MYARLGGPPLPAHAVGDVGREACDLGRREHAGRSGGGGGGSKILAGKKVWRCLAGVRRSVGVRVWGAGEAARQVHDRGMLGLERAAEGRGREGARTVGESRESREPAGLESGGAGKAQLLEPWKLADAEAYGARVANWRRALTDCGKARPMLISFAP